MNYMYCPHCQANRPLLIVPGRPYNRMYCVTCGAALHVPQQSDWQPTLEDANVVESLLTTFCGTIFPPSEYPCSYIDGRALGRRLRPHCAREAVLRFDTDGEDDSITSYYCLLHARSRIPEMQDSRCISIETRMTTTGEWTLTELSVVLTLLSIPGLRGS